MKPKYNVGEKVKVIDLTDWEDDFRIGTNKFMRSMSGSVVVIKEANESWCGTIYRIEEDYGAWQWLEGMFTAMRPCKFMKKKV